MTDWVDVSRGYREVACFEANIRPDGFFDAGMLLQALKANKDEPKGSEMAVQRRRAVGKKLAISEY